MPSIVTSEPCVICVKNFAIMHSHHTTPRCRGGEESPQVILCPNDHNVLHAHALYLVSRLRNPNAKRNTKTFWPTHDQEMRAMPLVELIVKSFLDPQAQNVERTHLVSAELETEDFLNFKLLAQDLGCSQENALKYCIKMVIKMKGISDDRKQKSKSAMWFLPKS